MRYTCKQYTYEKHVQRRAYINPGLVIVLLAAMVVLTVIFTMAVTRVEPEKKVFGLNQLRGAKRYGARTAEQMRLILAVFCGVAGYSNTVAEDVKTLVVFQQQDIHKRYDLISESENEINIHRARIANLDNRNKESEVNIAEAAADLLLVQDSTTTV